MNYFKKILSLLKYNTAKKEKKSYAVLGVWRAELIATALLLLIVFVFDWWIYYNVASRGAGTSSDRISTVEAPHKQIIMDATGILTEHENKLNNPLFPLIGDPF